MADQVSLPPRYVRRGMHLGTGQTRHDETRRATSMLTARIHEYLDDEPGRTRHLKIENTRTDLSGRKPPYIMHML